MRSKLVTRRAVCLGILGTGLFLGACGSRAAVSSAEPPGPMEAMQHVVDPGVVGPEGHEAGEKDKGHAGADPGEATDLDRPVEELFSATCNHGKRTFECDECRYEIGVVRVAPSIIDGGLLRIADAAPRAVDARIWLTGEVRFDERRVTHLAARTDGVLRGVHAQVGDLVREGQVLFEVDSIALGDAQGEYLEARAARALAVRTLERQKALLREGVTSEREALEAQNGFESADIRFRSAAERLLRLGVDAADLGTHGGSNRLGSARGRLVVRAPNDGRVLEMHAVLGESVKAGESLVVIGQTDPVWVFADLYEDLLGAVQNRVATGPVPAMVSVKAYPDEEFAGTLDLLSAVMDQRTRTVKARVTVANPDGKLKPGMFARVRLAVPGDEEVLAIPRAAVMQDQGRSFVFVPHHEDYWVRRPIRTGREWDEWVEVKEGIQAGQQVAADGAFLLKSDVLRSRMGAGCAD